MALTKVERIQVLARLVGLTIAADEGAIAGYDPRDPFTSRQPVPDYTARLGTSIRGLRLGVIRELVEHDDMHSQVKQALEASLDVRTGDALAHQASPSRYQLRGNSATCLCRHLSAVAAWTPIGRDLEYVAATGPGP